MVVIVGFTCKIVGCIPESAGCTCRVSDENTVMMVVRYFWCTMVQAAVMSSLTSISSLGESRVGLPLYSSYVCVTCLKVVAVSQFAEADL